MPFPTLFPSDKAAFIESSESINISLFVEGMKCAGCVQAVERQLDRMDGVQSATVNLVTKQAKVELNPALVEPKRVAQALTDSGFTSTVIEATPFGVSSMPSEQEQQLKQNLIQLLVAIALVVFSALGHVQDMLPLQLPLIDSMSFHAGLATLALVWPGRKIITEGTIGLLKNRPTMDTLVSMGSVTAYTVSIVALAFPNLGWECFFDAPVMIIGLILLGRTLESQARSKARTSFESLLSLQSQVAYRVKASSSDIELEEVPIEVVRPGDRLQVYLGDRFPVDGVIISGQTLVDESMLTGESLPSQKAVDDDVTAGTLNQGDTIVMQAKRTGAETTLAQIIRMVEEAQTRKAPIQGLADRVAGIFTYGVMAIALCTFLFWWGIGSHLWPQVIADLYLAPAHMGMMTDMAEPKWVALLVSLKLAIAVMVIACPCALGLATPTAILVGTSLGSERGLLLNGGDVLEKCHQLQTIVFDKTGTLTTGQMIVTNLSWSSSYSEKELLRYLASVEQQSRHPLSLAIQSKAQTQNIELFQPDMVQQLSGRGLEAQYQGSRILVGSQDLLAQQGICMNAADLEAIDAWMKAGKTVVFCAVDQNYIGAIACQDELREDAVETVQRLKNMGLSIKVLTGDRPENTVALLKRLNLDSENIEASLSPQAKLERIQAMQVMGPVAMVGDGINDSPALAQADVGIALSSGTDMAMETAQIVLTRSEINENAIALADIVAAIKLSRATFRKIKQNLVWAFGYNILGIPVAAGIFLPKFHYLLTPAAAAALMACSSVSVVANSLLLQRRWKNS